MKYHVTDENALIFENYLKQINRLKSLNFGSTLLIGLSGTWWLWIYGVILFNVNQNFQLLFYAFVSFIIIISIANLNSYQSYTKKGWIVRFISFTGIIVLHEFYNTETVYSIIVFSYAVILQDTLYPIIRRLLRTQKYFNKQTITLNEISGIKANTDYIEDRLNWAVKTTFLVLIVGIVYSTFTFVLTKQTSIFNSQYLQYISILAFVILGILFIPKMLPKVKLKDPVEY